MAKLNRVVQLRLTDDQYQELEAMAAGSIAISQLVRLIIGAALAGPESQVLDAEFGELPPRVRETLTRWATQPVGQG